MANAEIIALEVLGCIGTGAKVTGLLTANPLLVGAGTALEIGSVVVTAAIRIQQGDGGGLVGDAFGAAAGFVLAGKLIRTAGAARSNRKMKTNEQLKKFQ